jgi:hypothetical protein
MNLSKVRSLNLFIIILIIAGVLRLYRVTNPIADWHSFRQADTASVTREYVKNGIDLLRPTYHDLGNIQSGKDNLVGYRMVEFPFINAGIAMILRTFTFLPLELTSRLFSIIFSVGAIACLYYFVLDVSSKKLALWSSFFMAVLPYSVYYSRVTLPEPFMLFFSLFSIMSFNFWLTKDKFLWFLLSLASFSLALLLKPFVVFTFPVYISLILMKKKWKFLFNPWLILYVVVSFVPLLFWRNWIVNFPEGVPASDWLLNGNGIRLRPAWFRWLFFERITKMMVGYAGVILLLFNLIKKDKDFYLYASWWVGMILFLIVVASGNVQHDYYQTMLVPIISISLGRGLILFHKKIQKIFSENIAKSFSGILIMLTLFLSWNQVKGFFNVNHWEYVHTGKVADKILPADAKVIAPAMGDTVFLFQTNRTGWPIGFNVEDKIKLGATHYVTSSYDDEARELEEKYEVLEKTDMYLILDLRKEKN